MTKKEREIKMDQPYEYMRAVEDPGSFIKSYLHEKPSGLRHLLREMQTRKRVTGSVPKMGKSDYLMKEQSPSAYARVL